MKKILAAALLAFVSIAQFGKADEFDDFLKSEISDFDSFINAADKDFVNFMRNPWKRFDAEKPVEKITAPKPRVPVVYKPSAVPEKPVTLTVEEIIDLTTRESSPVSTVIKTVDGIPAELPTTEAEPKPDAKPSVEKPQSEPATVEPETKHEPVPVAGKQKSEQKPVVKPDSVKKNKPKPATVAPQAVAKTKQKPTVSKQPMPVAKPSAATPVTKPKPAPKPVRVATEVKPKPVTKPTRPQTDQRSTSTDPLYNGGSNREAFQFAGINYFIDNRLKGSFRLSSVSENSIADAYEYLLRSNYNQLLIDLRHLRANNLGSDWALYMLIKQIAEKYVGKNESVVLRQFLLNKLGYKARIGRKAKDNQLTLLYVPDCDLYACVYVEINGIRYYDTDNKTGEGFFICEQDAPNATRSVKMEIEKTPKHGAETMERICTANGIQAIKVDVPKPLIQFFTTLPQCDYKVYATAPVDLTFENQLIPQLRKSIQGKNETDAAKYLLSFVQSAFKYQTDPQQFGFEKPFFVEELFYYPACDCEDRSILYRYLIKKLLGLDVVLLSYPNHIATAVKFKSQVNGDNIKLGNDVYTVCDPTFIGASIGEAMPQFKRIAAKVVKL